MQSESAKHDSAYAAALKLFELQQTSGRLAFGQIYAAVKDSITCYEVRMADTQRRLHPSKN